MACDRMATTEFLAAVDRVRTRYDGLPLWTFFREFDERPLSDAELWGGSASKFIGGRQEQRLIDSGVNPWTGEPDPYANLSFGDWQGLARRLFCHARMEGES